MACDNPLCDCINAETGEACTCDPCGCTENRLCACQPSAFPEGAIRWNGPEEEQWQKEWNLKNHRAARTPAYPQITEQLDLLWHAIDEGTLDKTSDFYIKLKKIKDDYPKPA